MRTACRVCARLQAAGSMARAGCRLPAARWGPAAARCTVPAARHQGHSDSFLESGSDEQTPGRSALHTLCHQAVVAKVLGLAAAQC